MRTLIRASFLIGALVAAPAFAQQWPATQPGAVPPPPPAADRFGTPGQIVISGEMGLDLLYTSIEPPQGDSLSATNIAISPALDYFVVQNVSVGGVVSLTHDRYDQFSAMGVVRHKDTSLLITPTVGYNLDLGPRLSLFPRAGVGYLYSTSSVEGGPDSGSSSTISLMLQAPVLIHPVEHFFIGFGPVLLVDLISKFDDEDLSKRRRVGLVLEIGGWF